MCGRYALFGIDELKGEYGLPPEFQIEPNYNVAPAQTMPVITDKGLEMMRWGIIPAWARDEKIGYRLINTRSETVFEKPIWKKLIMEKRCLIPANGFYEWQKTDNGKQPYYIHAQDQSLFMFAGIWETWEHEGLGVNTYSIMTTKSNKGMMLIHDRMPVIIDKKVQDEWLLAGGRGEIEAMLSPLGENEFDIYPVSREVNTARVNEARLIQPVDLV